MLSILMTVWMVVIIGLLQTSKEIIECLWYKRVYEVINRLNLNYV